VDRLQGRSRRSSPEEGGPNKRVAKEVLDGVLGNVARRQHLGVIEDSAISLADFAEAWWKRVAHTLKPRSQERWRGILDGHLSHHFQVPCEQSLPVASRVRSSTYRPRRPTIDRE